NVSVSPDVWAQGRIAAMIANKPPDQRKPLQDLMQAKWNAVQGSNDLATLRDFVAKFGSLFAVGREARLHLAQRLMDSQEPDSLFEAERQLDLLQNRDNDPNLAAQLLEAHA